MTTAKPRSKIKFRREEAGSVAIEFALASFFFLLPLVAGTVEVGVAVYQNMQVYAAVEAGALYAQSDGWDQAGIQTAVTGAFGSVATNGLTNVTATPVPTLFCGCPTGSTVVNMGTPPCSLPNCANGNPQRQYTKISATLTRTSVIPIWGPIFGLPTVFQAKSLVRIN
jgi:Flp pilus assembly protein TadG